MKRNNSYLIGNQFAKGRNPNKTSFKKGRSPWNKTLKGIHLSPGTEFKKGQKAPNERPLGYVTTRKDKSGEGRRWIKTGKGSLDWIEYARFVWTKWRGKIPSGLLVHHADENSLNDKISNLY